MATARLTMTSALLHIGHVAPMLETGVPGTNEIILARVIETQRRVRIHLPNEMNCCSLRDAHS